MKPPSLFFTCPHSLFILNSRFQRQHQNDMLSTWLPLLPPDFPLPFPSLPTIIPIQHIGCLLVFTINHSKCTPQAHPFPTPGCHLSHHCSSFSLPDHPLSFLRFISCCVQAWYYLPRSLISSPTSWNTTQFPVLINSPFTSFSWLCPHLIVFLPIWLFIQYLQLGEFSLQLFLSPLESLRDLFSALC